MIILHYICKFIIYDNFDEVMLKSSKIRGGIARERGGISREEAELPGHRFPDIKNVKLSYMILLYCKFIT